MINDSARKDLVVLLADKNTEYAVRGVLDRPDALGIRPILADLFVHLHNDPGCLREGHEFLRSFTNQYRHAIVMLDREGCGRQESTRQELEEQIEERLSNNGWAGRAAAIVLDPELEIWVWSDSPEVDNALGWLGRTPDLRNWLREQELLGEDAQKPARPKEALEQALILVRKPRSSSIYMQLAKTVSLRRCDDPAFVKFRTILKNWFAKSET